MFGASTAAAFETEREVRVFDPPVERGELDDEVLPSSWLLSAEDNLPNQSLAERDRLLKERSAKLGLSEEAVLALVAELP